MACPELKIQSTPTKRVATICGLELNWGGGAIGREPRADTHLAQRMRVPVAIAVSVATFSFVFRNQLSIGVPIFRMARNCIMCAPKSHTSTCQRSRQCSVVARYPPLSTSGRRGHRPSNQSTPRAPRRCSSRRLPSSSPSKTHAHRRHRQPPSRIANHSHPTRYPPPPSPTD